MGLFFRFENLFSTNFDLKTSNKTSWNLKKPIYLPINGPKNTKLNQKFSFFLDPDIFF
jgi:hypothetical protein